MVALCDCRRVISGSWDKTLRVWDVDTGECVRELQGHGNVSGDGMIIPRERFRDVAVGVACLCECD
jgi:WD40 repeat protein